MTTEKLFEDLKVFQAYFSPSHKGELIPGFEPLDVSMNPIPDMREFPIIRSLYEEGRHKEKKYTGLFSWKFSQKMKNCDWGPCWDSLDYYREVEEFLFFHSNRDVYLFNPFGGDIENHGNVWRQGEWCHPGMCNIVETMFRELSLETNDPIFDMKDRESILQEQYGHETYSMCNFWIGNEKFWDRYIHFVGTIYDFINSDRISPDLKEAIHRNTFHAGEGSVWFIPFIIERCTSTLISWDDGIESIGWVKNWKAQAY